MNSNQLNPAQAILKLTILSKQAEAKNSYEVYSQMKDLKLPNEVIEILDKIIKLTSKVAGKVISIGKILVIEIMKYAMEHPIQIAGLAIGLGATFAIGVAVHGLYLTLTPTFLTKLPLLGSLILKLGACVSKICGTLFLPVQILAPVIGTVAGDIMEKKYREVSESLKRVAKNYFELLSKIIKSVKDEFDFREMNPAWV